MARREESVDPEGWTDGFTPIYAELIRQRMKPVLAQGLDYSAGALTGATIRNAGYSFAIRYVDAPANVGRKHIRVAEYGDLVKAGVDVHLVFEIGTTDMLGGRPAGVANGRRALAGARWIGYPEGRPIFLACDMHVTGPQLTTALAYVDGAISVLGNSGVGVYGFWELVDACIATHRGVAYWQAGIAPDTTDAVNVWQDNTRSVVVGGIQCDVNHLLIPIPSSTPEDEMPAITQGTWEQTGTTVHQHLTCPVGPNFIFRSGWFSLSVGWADATGVGVWFLGTVNGTASNVATVAPFTLPRGVRLPFWIPPGTECISVEYTSDNPVGWSLELLT